MKFRLFTLLMLTLFSFSSFGQKKMLIPQLLSGNKFNLTMAPSTHEFFDGVQTNTFGFNGEVLGPTLVFRQGTNVDIKVTNRIGEISTLHWHGMHVAAENDGGPHTTISPNETWNPKFKIRDKASTMWYHPHLHTHTNDHVLMGLAGMIIIQDDEEMALDLPRAYGFDDFPVVLQSKTFDGNKQIVLGMNDNDTEFMANATRNAYIDVPANVIRLRLLNGSSQRVYNFGLSNNDDFYVIGTEGGLLGAPVRKKKMLIAPGERVEILIDLTQLSGETIALRNFGAGIPRGYYGAKTIGMGPNAGGGNYGANPLNGGNFDMLTLKVGAKSNRGVNSIPNTLVEQISYDPNNIDKGRNFTFSSAGGMMSVNGPFRINGQSFNMNVINETVDLGNTEIWSFTNMTAVAHPFHIHDVQFYVLDINGQAPPPEWQGRKDVILVPPFRGTVRFITKFEDFANDKVPYMYHCHMLTHEDQGMMGQFVVVGDPVVEPDPITLIDSEINNASCRFSEDGSISLNIEGENPPFTVYWNTNDSNNGELTDISAGVYSATIFDSKNNSLEVGPFQVGFNSNGVNASVNEIVDANCSELGSIDIQINSGTPESFLWSNGSTTEDAVDLEVGTYSLTITGTGGCTTVLDDLTVEGANPPIAQITTDNFSLDCLNTAWDIDASASTIHDGDIISWTTDEGQITSNMDELVVSIDKAGTYTLSISNENGCSSEASITIENAEVPVANIDFQGPLNCNQPCITLNGNESSDGENIQRNWTTLDGMITSGTTSDYEITICESGTYDLTVVNNENGCSSTASAIVTEDKTAPNFQIQGNHNLTCYNESTTLTPTNLNENFEYNWSDSNGDIGNDSEITINNAGSYQLSVTNPENGCVATEIFDVVEDKSSPIIQLSVSNEITCAQNTATIQVDVQNNAGTTFNWTLPNGETNVDDINTLNVNETGIYTLVATGVNGCKTTEMIEVTGSSDVPDASASANGNITCNTTMVTLSASSTNDNVSYEWVGPNGFTSSEQNPATEMAGTYTLTITNEFGCSATSVVEVSENTSLPQINNISGFKACENSGLNIDVAGDNLSFEWVGPNGFTSNEQNPSLEIAEDGDYICYVSNEFGCTSQVTTQLEDKTDYPVILNTNGLVNCNESTLNIQTESNDNYTYSWTGPNGFTSNEQNPDFDFTDGTYACEVTSEGGCVTYSEAVINIDTENPDVNVQGGTLDCNTPEINLSTQSNDTNLTYNWEGPNGFESTDANPSIDQAGAYILTATNPKNGCKSEKTVTVLENKETYETSLETITLDCDNVITNLPSTVENHEVTWTSPNGTLVSDEISDPGEYQGHFMIANGCEGIAKLTINADKDIPEFEMVSTPITCKVSKAVLSIEIATPYRSVAWSGPGITSDNKFQANPEVEKLGVYSAKVTGENGCEETKENTVVKAPDLDVAVQEVTNISCFGLSDGKVDFELVTGTPPLFYDETKTTNLVAGSYTVEIADDNGCTENIFFEVIQPDAIDITFDEIKDATNGTLGQAKATVTGGTAPYTYLWDDNSTESKNKNLSAGEHSVTITDANGCSQEMTITIEMASGLESIAALNYFKVNPNPNHGFFTIQLKFETPSDFEIQLVSVLGNEVYFGKVTHQKTFKNTIDVSSLSAGTYFLKVNADGGQAVKKIVILD